MRQVLICGLIFGTSACEAELERRLRQWAPVPDPLILVGPSGVGKTVLARHIHVLSGRSGRFVDCPFPSIPEELRHSVLFGHIRGSFTGAFQNQEGKLEQARDGTLFLDELTYASRALQQSLLVAMDRREAVRLGDVRPYPINPRFLFATTREPRVLKESGDLCEELCYRLGDFILRVPSLQERAESILPLARKFLTTALAEYGKNYRARLSAEVETLLHQYAWPGNIRELQSACRRMAADLDRDRPVQVEDLPEAILEEIYGTNHRQTDPRRRALAALEKAGGNKAAAARDLGISRQRFYRAIEASRSAERDSGEVSDQTDLSGHFRPAGHISARSSNS